MVNQKPIELHDFVNQTRTAETLGVSRMTIWQWIKDGKIQAVIVGGLIKGDDEAVQPQPTFLIVARLKPPVNEYRWRV